MLNKKILLHVCCGPCAEWPVEALRSEGFDVDAYFYNPNIHPQAEHDKRLENMRKMAEIHQVKLFVDGESMEAHWRSLAHLKKEAHCKMCYAMRLQEAARFAKHNSYEYLTTSLQVSPYQDQNVIRNIAMKACQDNGIIFVDRPFLDAFSEGQEQAKNDGLYRQKYCGCIFSLSETNPKFRARYLKEFALREENLPVREQ